MLSLPRSSPSIWRLNLTWNRQTALVILSRFLIIHGCVHSVFVSQVVWHFAALNGFSWLGSGRFLEWLLLWSTFITLGGSVYPAISILVSEILLCLCISYRRPSALLDHKVQVPIAVVECFLETQGGHLVKNIRWFLRLERNLHLLILQYLQLRQRLFRIQELESLILGFLSDEHVELGVLKAPYVYFLVYLLVQGLELEAEISWTLPLNEAIAVVVDLRVDLQPQHCPSLLRGLRESGEVVIAYLVLVPPEESYERTISSLLTLRLPAVVVDLVHCFICYSVLHFLGNSLAEWIY